MVNSIKFNFHCLLSYPIHIIWIFLFLVKNQVELKQKDPWWMSGVGLVVVYDSFSRVDICKIKKVSHFKRFFIMCNTIFSALSTDTITLKLLFFQAWKELYCFKIISSSLTLLPRVITTFVRDVRPKYFLNTVYSIEHDPWLLGMHGIRLCEVMDKIHWNQSKFSAQLFAWTWIWRAYNAVKSKKFDIFSSNVYSFLGREWANWIRLSKSEKIQFLTFSRVWKLKHLSKSVDFFFFLIKQFEDIQEL